MTNISRRIFLVPTLATVLVPTLATVLLPALATVLLPALATILIPGFAAEVGVKSGNQGQRDLDHFVPQRHEDPVLGIGSEYRTPGETAECREDERVVAKKETGQTQGSAFAVGDFHDRVPVTGDVQPVAGGMRGIVNDAEVTFQIQMGDAAEPGGQPLDFHVVISSHEGDRDSQPGNEIDQRGVEFGRDAGGRVEKVARDDEMRGVVLSSQLQQPLEIARRVTLGDRQAARAEGRGFPEMDVSHHQ
jgi:hypothetical protein